MLDTLDLSYLPDPERAAAQRVAILDAKRRSGEVMNQAFEIPDMTRMMTAIHVYQTLMMQKAEQLRRVYGPHLAIEAAAQPATLEAALPIDLSDSLIQQLTLLQGEPAAAERALSLLSRAYRDSTNRPAFLAELNTRLAARGISLAARPGRSDENLWLHQGLIGSSIPRPSQDAFEDFPGDDSVATFIERMRAEYPGMVADLETELARLRAKYPDHAQYRWYHAAMGNQQSVPNRDFPGDDSLELFTRRLYARVIPRRPGSVTMIAAPGSLPEASPTA